MEKRRPSFDLEAFKAVCGDARRLSMTVTAFETAAQLGFGRSEIATVIRSMRRSHFHKSMTSYADSRHWQDVYHVPWEELTLYIKFTDDVLTEFVVLSFKEK